MSTTTYSNKWDLDSIFNGGSDSLEFSKHLDSTTETIAAFENLVSDWSTDHAFVSLKGIIDYFEKTAKMIRQAGAFVSCLQAQNTEDKKANDLKSRVTGLSASLQTALTNFDNKLARIEDGEWSKLMESENFTELAFVLTERRERAKEKRSQQEEALINLLGVDGYHGWGQMYDLLVSKVKIPFDQKFLSVGQAANLFSNPDRNVRKTLFESWEKSWAENADLFSKTLNHLSGFRLNVYKLRGWDSVLKEPLQLNRMTKGTLDAMWSVISDSKKPLVDYLNRKAKLIGVEKLSWYDLDAPYGKTETKASYQEGADFITEQFSRFGEEMASFAKMAFEDQWIEAEDRPGKSPGGFHTYFPESGQSRIFMTYSGTPSNISTLAHELGHGFHTYAMKGLHHLNRNYAMNVAETASTFAEMIVSDAALNQADTEEEKLVLLDDKIQRSVALLMNIHARFIFENNFYEERGNGTVSTDRLNELMKNAQEEAYGGALEEYHPMFWASKLHFFITGVPFYNFPYTFGFLFSLGIYSRALEEGKGYEEKYIEMLKDSASMTVENLAQKHLQVDITKRDFWEKAVSLCIKDIEEFLVLTDNK
ncbi:MAG: M3 family oligoendopeptidase [Bacillota bacterium]|nr:M3 family oligoendopeptidase [Bacillota bacterium]